MRTSRLAGLLALALLLLGADGCTVYWQKISPRPPYTRSYIFDFKWGIDPMPTTCWTKGERPCAAPRP